MKAQSVVIVIGSLVLVGVLAATGQEPPAPTQESVTRPQLPDLAAALKDSPGCLGIDVARRTLSGKSVIFAWFEDKKAVSRWYYSEVHQQLVDQFFTSAEPDERHKLLEGLSDDSGPIMIIASMTPAEQSHFQDTTVPVSQLAIELYRPITGGLFLGERFAPEGVKVGGMVEIRR